ncbi:MAG: rRNA maturation RNase YbeY [Smithellaceae bacterium]|jgi:probable rRNA maturation factor|nr:rRNA maturation RNase YbeY [Smithellaceae bacterium]MDD3258035.1 rRNA maturation RNase YbeY [Smithellaceae bacterium]MDD3848106.1 rRNA maturation RNase YbeY [Smithellaceae bacterium]HOG11879.1 rRNA maturation RNase YbeY [Smithellaceae bacterium]HOQ71419.1 rRNA maturation RNase YbeY [Smithellaceae bacterium]
MKIRIANLQKRLKIDNRRIRGRVARLLRLIDCAEKEISITFVDDEAIRLLNRQYLRLDKPTNVLSFSLKEGECGMVNPGLLGDIVISADTALRDARKGSLTLEEELLFLIIHGLLHLTGYDHVRTSRANALKMKKREQELFLLLTHSDIRSGGCHP